MPFKKGKSADEIVSHLGEGAELIGEISFTNRLRVNGTIKGKVRSEALLEIGPTGRLEAEIDVKKVVIKGEFRGVIRASERVEIQKDGKVFGDIFSPCLIIEAGALFEGRCNMSQGSTGAEA
ncbi:MAG: polymer-forming cytoskeletal protein [Acidobacteria bacterium]|nr:polymer-forming cytoskeletal protein [Acidobacteriota bacterium]